MKLSKGDFNGLIYNEELAYARYTELEAQTNVSERTVRYVVRTRLEIMPFSKTASIDAKTYSLYYNVFDDLDEAIKVFNKIQELAEKGELVHVVGV